MEQSQKYILANKQTMPDTSAHDKVQFMCKWWKQIKGSQSIPKEEPPNRETYVGRKEIAAHILANKGKYSTE